MTPDDITLPRDDDEEFTRERVTALLLEVMDWTYAKAHRERPMTEAEQKVLDDIRAALAAEQPKPEPVESAKPDHEAIRWQLCLLAQTEEFSDEVRNQIGRGVWLIDVLQAALRREEQT